jgi:hypothetical protein
MDHSRRRRLVGGRAGAYRGWVSVVRRSARRRWALVLGGVCALGLVPALLGALPAPPVDAGAGPLRARILASADQPYQGYAESRGSLGVPQLPDLGDVGTLLGGESRIRAWYAAPHSWRVATVEATGERDVYQTAAGIYVWDFERNQLVHLIGDVPARLPWAGDVTPPELARRLLRRAASNDEVTSIGSRRIAGRVAAGLRLTPADPTTTVGRVDVWADRATGLPLRVELAGRGRGDAVFTSRFLDLELRRPDPALLTPPRPESAGFVTTEVDSALVIDRLLPTLMPPTLAGRSRLVTPSSVSGAGAYGEGWATFVAVQLPGRVGGRTVRAIERAGGTSVDLVQGEAFEINTELLSILVVRSGGNWSFRRTFLLAGFVGPEVLRQAAIELYARRP